MTQPKYIIFNYEGGVFKTDSEEVAQNYKEYEYSLVVRTEDGTVWSDKQTGWVSLDERTAEDEEENEENEDE